MLVLATNGSQDSDCDKGDRVGRAARAGGLPPCSPALETGTPSPPPRAAPASGARKRRDAVETFCGCWVASRKAERVAIGSAVVEARQAAERRIRPGQTERSQRDSLRLTEPMWRCYRRVGL